MPQPSPSPDALIETYLRAKDGNRPHLMAHAFAPDATLHMTVKSDVIAFPACTEGAEAIADVLVRRFGQRYENVYSFYLTGSRPASDATHYGCDWLVGMTDKLDAGVRVGCGSYRWAFGGHDGERRIVSFTIAIESMELLAAETAQRVFDDWLVRLPYPWCTAAQAAEHMPAFAQLAPIRAYLAACAETARAV